MRSMLGRIPYPLRSVFCAVAALAGGCASILGLSACESADKPGSSSGVSAGETAGGAEGSAGTEGGSEGENPAFELGGQSQGGTAGNASGGDATLAGAGGEAIGGGPSVGCQSQTDCDDDISCTVDRCDARGNCVHVANSSLCASQPGECLACQVGAGCVARALTTTELLQDKDFDLLNDSWYEYSANNLYTIFPYEFAHTAPNIVQLGPTPLDVLSQEYSLMSQMVVIPQGTQKLTLAGRYQLYPGGTSLDIHDDTRVAVLAGSSQTEVFLFNVWLGVQPETIFWKAFSYEATRAELTSVLGKQARLEFEARSWDTLFVFDTVSLQATVCPQK